MTFSLVARCPRTGQLGVGAMTAMIGVGKLVAHARSQVGAAASQAILNPYLAFDGLDRLADGEAADAVLDDLIAADPGAGGRQVGLVDAHGRSAAFTGHLPADWKGDRCGDGFAAQGNRLAGPEVLDDAVAAFHAAPDAPLVDRLLAALDAGQEAGGDTAGHRSATITVFGAEAYPLWDLRIDIADDPLEQLQRRYELFRDEVLPEIELLPTRNDPLGGFAYVPQEEGAV